MHILYKHRKVHKNKFADICYTLFNLSVDSTKLDSEWKAELSPIQKYGERMRLNQNLTTWDEHRSPFSPHTYIHAQGRIQDF